MNIDNLNRTNPFAEKDEYVAELISRSTENAISNPKSRHMDIPFMRIAASIAIVATIGCSGWMYMKHREAQKAPLDTFLSSISDEEAAMLDYYYLEDIDLEEY